MALLWLCRLLLLGHLSLWCRLALFDLELNFDLLLLSRGFAYCGLRLDSQFVGSRFYRLWLDFRLRLSWLAGLRQNSRLTGLGLLCSRWFLIDFFISQNIRRLLNRWLWRSNLYRLFSRGLLDTLVHNRFLDIFLVDDVVRIFKVRLWIRKLLRAGHVHFFELLPQVWVFLFVDFLSNFVHFPGSVSIVERGFICRFSIDDQLFESIQFMHVFTVNFLLDDVLEQDQPVQALAKAAAGKEDAGLALD